MTLDQRIADLAQAVGVDIKALTSAQGTLASLTTTAKGSLVAAINELAAAGDQLIVASEALSAGAWVNLWDSSGARVRNASAAVDNKPVDGWVLAAVAAGGVAVLRTRGTNTLVTGQTVGPVFLQDAPGVGGSAVPTLSAGKLLHRLGFAVTATAVVFAPWLPVKIA